MLISSSIPLRLLNISWMGICSAFFTRELVMMTNSDSPDPEMKYIQGLPFPARGFASSFFQPSDRQKGKSQIFGQVRDCWMSRLGMNDYIRSEEHTSELQSQSNLV